MIFTYSRSFPCLLLFSLSLTLFFKFLVLLSSRTWIWVGRKKKQLPWIIDFSRCMGATQKQKNGNGPSTPPRPRQLVVWHFWWLCCFHVGFGHHSSIDSSIRLSHKNIIQSLTYFLNSCKTSRMVLVRCQLFRIGRFLTWLKLKRQCWAVPYIVI